ncbi:hypothetical protein Y032_0447g1629 [Ancylostoma ceylanicum]|uniref:Uncharacterized protein n=1 Tax=Ancylostoma ceylanicum TaxID=53326 RepID=A0A016X025_9BILA|nr:hypothetical protein Y032_0447g1629 [Ancylostoma ceylanicum]
MFVNTTMKMPSLESDVHGGEIASDKASSTIPRDVTFWILFSINLSLMMLSFTLNLFLTIVLIQITLRDLCSN